MRNWINLFENHLPTEAEMDELCQGIDEETGAHIEAHMLDGDIHIEYVEGGGGTGWEAIRQLCDYADALNLNIVLSVLDGAPGLVTYYLRHGFTVDYMSVDEVPSWLMQYQSRYDYDDFETHENVSMTRLPGTMAKI